MEWAGSVPVLPYLKWKTMVSFYWAQAAVNAAAATEMVAAAEMVGAAEVAGTSAAAQVRGGVGGGI